jgi:hypothetical protein
LSRPFFCRSPKRGSEPAFPRIESKCFGTVVKDRASRSSLDMTKQSAFQRVDVSFGSIPTELGYFRHVRFPPDSDRPAGHCGMSQKCQFRKSMPAMVRYALP